MTSKLVALVEQWDETTRYNESESAVLRELSYRELGERFGLDENESGMFWYIIKEDEDVRYCAYGLKEENGNLFLEMVQEAIHQSFDGMWTEYDRIVIRTFLSDVTWATHQDSRVVK